MAEFKLGRIRFVWKDQWTSDTEYYKDDVVTFGGKAYICIVGHTSQELFNDDLTNQIQKWNVIAEGQSWRGTWQVNTYYTIDDIVSYGARLYICNTVHTSSLTAVDETDGLEADIDKWTVLAEGLNWRNEWSVSTRYRVNDLVKYGGITYVCTLLHVSAATVELGLEDDAEKWTIFNKGLEYKQEWVPGIRYKVNDLVRYGASTYICVTKHTSVDFGTDIVNWAKYVDGIQYEDDWSPFPVYQIGDIVRYGGNQYIAKQTNNNKVPTSNLLTDWSLFSEGITFVGEWNEDSSNQGYKVGEVVRLGGYTYICVQDHSNQRPPNVLYWTLLNSGFKWRGEWLDDQEYFEGDVVRFGSNSYVCIKYHVSEGDDYSTQTTIEPGGGAENSRPDLDLEGLYWNIMALGTEESVLTTKGDLIVFGDAAPFRFPIGKEGQVLKVRDSLPIWEYNQFVEDVYHVAEYGADIPYPVQGYSTDRPWKTIRYAAEQIEKGVKFPDAQEILRSNRIFIQREVNAYIRDQVANAEVGSIWENFTYDTFKCERDVGFIVDRIIYDMSHGGNLKMRAAAQTFLNALDDGPFSTQDDSNGTGPYGNLSVEGAQSVAAYTYMLSIIDSLFKNEAPEVIYQNATDDSVALIEPLLPTGLIAEEGAYTRANELANIVITALDTGSVNSIPDREVPQVLILVSTGRFYETLPIIVPAYAAVQGQELRSTEIFAGSGTIPSTDSYYTVTAFDRFADITKNIVLGNSVQATTGNTVLQNQNWPFPITEQSETVESLSDVIKYQIDYRLNTMHSAYVTDPIGFTADLENARENIKANIDFLIAETLAFLAFEYPDLKYGKTDTRRDTRYIIDALIFDLTYGGNYQSVLAGQAYWSYDSGTSQLPTSITAATVAAINYLKTTAQNVAGNVEMLNTYQTAVPQVLTGNVGSITQIADNVEDIVALIQDSGALGSTVTLVLPSLRPDESGSSIATGLTNAFNSLQAASSTIQTDTNNWIAANYPDLVYDSVKCARDVEAILTAVGLDFLLNSNWNTIKAAHAYLRKYASEVYTKGQKDVTRAALQYALLGTTGFNGAYGNVGGNALAIARIEASARIIDGILFGATNDGDICQAEDQNVYYAIHQLERNREFIVSEMSAWTQYNFSDFNTHYDSNLCQRDVGYVLDAVSYDLITGSNMPSSVAGAAYFRQGSRDVVNKQLLQTVESFKEVKRLALGFITDSTVRLSVQASFNNIIRIIEDGLNAVPTYVFPANGTSDADNVTTGVTFQSNKASYITNVSNFLSANYNAQWEELGENGQAACQRDLGYIIDAVTFDITYSDTSASPAETNYQSIIAGEAYYSFGILQIDTGAEKTATLAALTELKSLLSAAAEPSSVTTVEARIDDIYTIIDSGDSSNPSTTYPIATNESAAVQTDFTAIQTNKAAITTDTTDFITARFSSYTYNQELCNRDTNLHIDALIYDLKYPGNYKSRYAARYYANAVTGSQEEDMFYLRDATGVRNCTLNGLNGDLTPPNEFGTSRTTAGAYCSLDPGWGPDDFTTWILSRSPYVQGVTTFGNAAIGQKIDGALHNGGNDSIVSNDFTQVISDGIGAWITNNGRAELVSVFSYYAHIGYLAETGGRIRATNGNNSYGTFGSVAEGVDPDEVAVTAVVDNRGLYDSTISKVNTDGDTVLNVEFGHAGNEYTVATIEIFGPGAGEEVVADEFRDGALNYVFVDQDPDPAVPIGGDGYLVVTNVAQEGTTTSITLSATDGNLSSTYIGMKVILVGGGGAGQFAICDTYDAGTKLMTVVKESDGTPGWDHFVPGTAIVAPNSSTTYEIEPAVSVTAPPETATTVSVTGSGGNFEMTAIEYVETSAEYTGVASTGGSGNGATFDVIRTGSKYFVALNNGGTGYTRLETVTIAGTDLDGLSPANDITVTLTTINSVDGAVIDFDFKGLARKGKFIGLNSTATNTYWESYDGVTWTQELFPVSGIYVALADGYLDDGSSNYKPSVAVAVSSSSNTVLTTTDGGTNWTSGTLGAGWTSSDIAFGAVNIAVQDLRFVVISSASQDVYYSLDGVNWNVTSNALPQTGYNTITYGKGIFVAFRAGSANTVWSEDGVTWNAGSGLISNNWTDVIWGNGRFLAISSTSPAGAYSLDGKIWSAFSLGTAIPRKIAYGQGVFVVTTDGVPLTSDYGLNWTALTLSGITVPTGGSGDGWSAIAFGNPAQKGVFVAKDIAYGDVLNVNRGARARARASVASEKIFEIRLLEPGSGYTVAPTITITDPNNTEDVILVPRLGNGSLGNPTFISRGSGYPEATGEVIALQSNGFADFPQTGSFVAVKRLSKRPVNGSNVEFDSLPGEYYKLVNTVSFVGESDGSYTAFLQVSPEIDVTKALPDEDPVELRIRFSQVRLTGHDFLDIGTGNFATTNYPNQPLQDPVQDNETVNSNGGRVFFTATDQDGNFRVGDLFSIEQSTGVATLNADAFNIAGLQELTLGEVTLGGNSASVNEFSTDPFFTANSDNVVPTQRAVKAYIESQIGGGGATLTVNSITAGDIFIGASSITTLSGATLNIKSNIEFSGSVLGLPLAFNYFLR